MMKIAETVSALLRKGEAALRAAVLSDETAVMDSAGAHIIRNAAVITGKHKTDGDIVLVVADSIKVMPDRFQGKTEKLPGGFVALAGKADRANAQAICRHFPWCTPSPLPVKGLSLQADTPGNARSLFAAAKNARFFPLAPTWESAVFTAFALDFRKPFGAPEKVVPLPAATDLLPAAQNGATPPVSEYAGRNFVLKENRVLFFPADAAEKCAVRWGNTLNSARGGASVTLAPEKKEGYLTPQEHLFIVRELRRRDLPFSGIAPRFSPDRKEFFRDLPFHAAIAGTYGACRLHLPELCWAQEGVVEALRSSADGFVLPWNPALCADLSRFSHRQFNLGNSTK